MAARFIDFDAARAEREEEPLRLRAFGKDFELPGSMSADLFVHLIRMVEGQGAEAEVPASDVVAILERVLPSAVLDELLAEPEFSQDDFVQLFRLVMEEYGMRAGVREGEVPAPNRAARRSKTPAPSRSRDSRATSLATPEAATASASPGVPSLNTGD